MIFVVLLAEMVSNDDDDDDNELYRLDLLLEGTELRVYFVVCLFLRTSHR